MKKILFVLIILIAFNNLSAKWTKNQQDVFLEECLTDASNEYCKCGLEWIMKKVPSPGKVTFDNIKEMTEFCAHLYPDGWTKSQKDFLMNDCLDGADYKYCICELEWIIKKVKKKKNVVENDFINANKACAHLYPKGWTKPIQEGIIKECTKDSSYNTCKCLLHWIMKKVPNPKNVTEKDAKEAEKACMKNNKP